MGGFWYSFLSLTTDRSSKLAMHFQFKQLKLILEIVLCPIKLSTWNIFLLPHIIYLVTGVCHRGQFGLTNCVGMQVSYKWKMPSLKRVYDESRQSAISKCMSIVLSLVINKVFLSWFPNVLIPILIAELYSDRSYLCKAVSLNRCRYNNCRR